ncbi:MAG: hypothetical protein WEB52_04205 [Dehalococcoidia bacterium]
MQPPEKLVVVALAPVVVLGIIAVAIASALGSGILAFALGSCAIVCAAGAAWRATVMERTRMEARTERTPAQVASVRVDRRRPTFDRETGLLAEWYFRLRFEEEIARAKRYGHALAGLTIKVSAPTADAIETARLAARAYLRQVDFAGDLGGVIGICLPDTSREASQVVVDRLQELVPGIEVTTREYPGDGETLSALLNEQSWHTTPESARLDEQSAA